MIFNLLVVWLATTTGQTFYIDRLKEEIRERALLIEPTITTLSPPCAAARAKAAPASPAPAMTMS